MDALKLYLNLQGASSLKDAMQIELKTTKTPNSTALEVKPIVRHQSQYSRGERVDYEGESVVVWEVYPKINRVGLKFKDGVVRFYFIG